MRIKKLSLLTLDIEEQFDFYTRVLELEGELQNDEAHIQVGDTRLVFKNDPHGQINAYHFAINIPENKFEEAADWLSERCPLIADKNGEESFHFDTWNSHSVYAYDPSGNIIELIARHDLENASNAEFSSKDFLNISEIGLASEDVSGTVEAFQKEYNLNIYKESRSESFAAVGNEHGLFILAQKGREWFPDTEVPAEILPLQVDFESDNGTNFTISLPNVLSH